MVKYENKGGEDIYKYNIELFKEMYYHELAQKENINNRISIPLGILTLLIGVASYYINSIYNLTINTWFYIFISVLVVYSILIIICIYLLYKAYYGYEYTYISTAKVIDEHTEYYINYYDQYYDNYFSRTTNCTKNELIENAVNKKLYELYKDSIDTNAKLNEDKLVYLRKIGGIIIITVIVGAICVIPLNLCLNKNPTTYVEIVNSESYKSAKEVIKVSDDKGNKNDSIVNVEPIETPPPPNPPKMELRRIIETFTKTKEPKEDNLNE
jgi:hypothetical protein